MSVESADPGTWALLAWAAAEAVGAAFVGYHARRGIGE
jgi:hypothetical protein